VKILLIEGSNLNEASPKIARIKNADEEISSWNIAKNKKETIEIIVMNSKYILGN
jgi:hypothetical protein